jgi:hypothetical protein
LSFSCWSVHQSMMHQAPTQTHHEVQRLFVAEINPIPRTKTNVKNRQPGSPRYQLDRRDPALNIRDRGLTIRRLETPTKVGAGLEIRFR